MKKNNAFTLIELLIASGIFAVVMISAYSAFNSGLLGYRNIGERVDTYQAARTVLERLNPDLRNAFSYSRDEARFTGKKEEITFLTLADTYTQDKMIQEYAFAGYRLADKKMMRLLRRNRDALNNNSETQPEEMAAGVKELSFTYLYLDPADNSLKEKDSWDDPKALPAAVKVKLTFEGKIAQSFESTIFLSGAG